MHRDMIALVAADLILRFVLGGMMGIAFVKDIFGVAFEDRPAHPSRFRIPAYMVADLECPAHVRLRSSAG